MKNFKKLIFVTIFIFTMMLAIQAKTVNLVDFGAVANDGNDDSQAIQAGFSDLVDAGGGTLVFPSGVTEIQSRFEVTPLRGNSVKMTGDKGAVIRFNTSEPYIMFDIRDGSQVEIEGLLFMGNQNTTFDVINAISFEDIKQIKISKCNFFGVGANETLISYRNAFLSIEDSLFSGSSATQGLITSNSSKGLSIINSIFENFGEARGEVANKPSMIPQSAWVKVTNPVDTNPTSRGNVRIKDTSFDSAAANQICLENQLLGEISGVSIKLSGTKTGAGISANNVGNLEIVNTSFTETRKSLGAFNLKNSTFLNANGLVLSEGAKIGTLDSTSQRSVGHCIGCTQLLTLKKK